MVKEDVAVERLFKAPNPAAILIPLVKLRAVVEIPPKKVEVAVELEVIFPSKVNAPVVENEDVAVAPK